MEKTDKQGKYFNSDIAIYYDRDINYPDDPPYNPSNKYPEYFMDDISLKNNGVYDAVRNTFLLLGLDKENFGKPEWNPFKNLIKPGNKVVIKPNFVVSSHENSGELFSIITHPSVLRAVVDYAYIALNGKGEIIICDAPDMNCNFSELLESTKLESIKILYEGKSGFDIKILDLRNFWLQRKSTYKGSGSSDRHNLPGDPLGGVLVNLGRESLFYGLDNEYKYYGADFNRDETIKHHSGENHEYLISRTILSADSIISVPKLKVHKKVGVTLNIKGLVGTNVNKNYLVHFKLGSPKEGGDEYPENFFKNDEIVKIKLQRWAYDKLLSRKNKTGDFFYELLRKTGKFFFKLFNLKLEKNRSVIDGGNWHGNDSTWRMAVDLLRIFTHADKDGKLRDRPSRNLFSIVDGVIGGEGNGPLTPDCKKCGIIVAGNDFFLVDFICAKLIGFDYRKIKKLKYIYERPDHFGTNIKNVKIFSNNTKFVNLLDSNYEEKYFDFKPPAGWKDYLKK
jgi:uncharacterized protein (DUF362 family)